MNWRNLFGFSQPALELTNEVVNKKEPNRMFARIDDSNNLFSPQGELITTYSRRRDAIRGAKRRGFKIA